MTPRSDPRLALWLLCALILPMFLPVLPQLAGAFLGVEFVDHYGTQWFYWFVERALVDGDSLLWTDRFFYPIGKDIYEHTGANVLDAVAAQPFRWLLGPVAGYNAFVLVMLALSGLSIYRLSLAVTGDTTASSAAGVLAACSPFVLQELVEGRAMQSILIFPALTLLMAWRCGVQHGWRWSLLGGIFLALCGYQYWYYALFGGLIVLALAAVRIARPIPEAGSRFQIFTRYGLMGAVALVLCAPAAWPLAARMQAGGAVPGAMDTATWGLTTVSTLTASGEEAGLFLWQPLRGTFGYYTLLEDGAGQIGERQSGTTIVESLVILIGAMLLPRGRRGAVMAMVVAGALLATGPVLMLGDGYIGNPVYIALTNAVGVMRRLWWPGRAYAFMVLLYGIGAAVILSRLARHGPWTQRGGALLLAAATLHGLSGRQLLPFPTWDATIPAGFRCLADGGEGGVLHLPFNWTQGHLYYQTAHGRPMLGGMRDEQDMFVPEEWREFRDGNTAVSSLIRASDSPGPRLHWRDEDLDALEDLGFEFVALRLDAFEPESPDLSDLVRISTRNQRRRLRMALGEAFGVPVYADARTELYSPWGAPSPCGSAGVEPDTAPEGSPNPFLATGLSKDTVQITVWPLLSDLF